MTGAERQQGPKRDRPLGGYAALTSLFLGLITGFSAWVRASGRELPDHISDRDLALIAVGTHKASRMLAKDRVTSVVRSPFTEVQTGPDMAIEEARGRGFQRAVGELLTCPHCLGLWIATAMAAGLVVAPRPTRWLASILSAVFASDLLQIAYVKAERSR